MTDTNIDEVGVVVQLCPGDWAEGHRDDRESRQGLQADQGHEDPQGLQGEAKFKVTSM